MAETSKIPKPPPSDHKAVRRSPREAPDDIEDIDDDDLELGSFDDLNKMTLGMRVVSFLTLLGAAAMVGYLVLLVLYPERFSPQDWIGASSEKQAEALARLKGFQLGGAYLGMTPDEARRVYPSLRLEAAPNGEQRGFFRHHEGEYRVFFRDSDWGGRAYRIQSLHYFPRVSYLELLTEVTGRYGKPTGSDCGTPADTIAILCRLHWKMKGVKLNAEIRTSVSASGNEARTSLRVTATDTRRDLAPAKAGKKKKRSLQDINPFK
jgi:hypothetical protein